jgi:hypothetical protein
MDTKKPWFSKTLILNLVVALCAMFIPSAASYIQAHPEGVTMGFAVVNMLLRLISKDAISLQD